jgi:4-hydroxy-tetrahydrodipicolinate synthase
MEFPNYVALKAACGDLNQIATMRKLTPPRFAIYSGDDGLTFPVLELGGCGVISVVAHVAGPAIQTMVTLFSEGKKAEAKSIHERLKPLFEVLFITTNPTPVKAAMAMLGFKTDVLRLPMIPATAKEKEAIAAVMRALDLLPS